MANELTVPSAPPASPQVALTRKHLLQQLSVGRARMSAAPDQAFIERIIQRISAPDLGLPQFPDVPDRLDRILSDSDSPLGEVVKVVQQDPALAARIWSLACNHRFTEPPNDLRAAVSRVGFDEIWRLGVEQALEAPSLRIPGHEDAVRELRLHGAVCGAVASGLAKEKRGPAYIAGLLHDVGRLVILREAVGGSRNAKPSPGLVERMTGYFHPGVGLLAAAAWGLSPQVRIGIGWHHHPAQAVSQYREIAWHLWLADAASWAVLRGDKSLLTDACTGAPGTKKPHPARIWQAAQAAFAQARG